MSVAVIILNYKRTPNIPLIVNVLQTGKIKPNEIIVVDNNPKSNLQIKGATLIRCGRNFGCMVRHAIGLVANTTHCLFIDDDLQVGPRTVQHFTIWGERLPDSILGYFGIRVNPEHKSPYTSGSRFDSGKIEKPIKVDIVLGRIHFCRKDKLAQAFTIFSKIQDYPPPGSGMDDILLSLANRHYGFKNYVIPAGAQSITHDLPDFGTGLYKRKGHFRMRNQAVQMILDYHTKTQERT